MIPKGSHTYGFLILGRHMRILGFWLQNGVLGTSGAFGCITASGKGTCVQRRFIQRFLRIKSKLYVASSAKPMHSEYY